MTAAADVEVFIQRLLPVAKEMGRRRSRRRRALTIGVAAVAFACGAVAVLVQR